MMKLNLTWLVWD